MIKFGQGRARSERTLEELEKFCLDDLERLSPEEREVLNIMLAELAEDDVTKLPAQGRLVDVLGSADWTSTPVDIETFIRDPYFMGESCNTMYPKLVDKMVELFSGEYYEAFLSGSIGWGKTFFASVGLCRILYELSCMKNPQKSFGLSSDTTIAITCLSASEALAMKVAFEGVAAKVKMSPYFNDMFQFRSNRKELKFPNNIWVAARAATDTSALGLNTISGFIDEANFYGTRQKQASGKLVQNNRADNIYAVMRRRIKSRFERNGKLPGILFVSSSKQSQEDFTERRIREAADDPHVFVMDYANWDVKPEAYFNAKRFWVIVGNEAVPSRILLDGEEKEFQETPLENTVLLDVPEDFRSDFESDLEGGIRDLGGISTVAINPFIQRREKIREAVDTTREHPFTTLLLDPSRPGSFRWDLMVATREERQPGGVTQTVSRPLLNPYATRHVHIDPSLRGDATGFVMTHIGGWKDVVRRSLDGKKFMEKAPVYVVDLMLKIIPPLGGEIVLADIRHLVYDLSAKGYSIIGVSLDSYQSADSIQQFNRQGYVSSVVSVDTSTDPYDLLKTALYEGRLSMYSYQPVLEQLERLQEDRTSVKRRVDHPAKGEKDVSDALAGTCFMLNKTALDAPLPMLTATARVQADPWVTVGTSYAPTSQNPSVTVEGDSGILPPFLGGGF